MDKIFSLFKIKCLFKLFTGFYCPGCGGTRAVYFFLTGHPILSIIYHPIVDYTAAVLIYVGIRRLLNKKYQPKNILLWLVPIIIVVNCLIKNILLITGHDVLTYHF